MGGETIMIILCVILFWCLVVGAVAYRLRKAKPIGNFYAGFRAAWKTVFFMDAVQGRYCNNEFRA